MGSPDNKAFIYDIQRYCIHDGPGIRTTVFLKGCQMRCGWCANPESQSVKSEIGFFKGRCRECGACASACPKDAIRLSEDRRIDPEKCDLCGACVFACPYDAYRIFGECRTREELMEEVMKDRSFYRKSGGGVTVSGGEPTLQAGFVTDFFGELKKAGIHTAIETNGDAPADVFARLAPVTDLFLFDVKHMDDVRHKEAAGVGNKRIFENLKFLTLGANSEVIMRIPVIPGFNDDDENIRRTADLAAVLHAKGSLRCVHLLKFHSMASGKYGALNKTYAYADIRPETDERMNEISDMFRQKGVPIQIGG